MKHRLLFIAFLLSCFSVFAQTPEWTSFFNNSTSANEFISDVSFDESGNTYLCGYGNMISGQGADFLVVKCNSDGAAEWTKTFNGPQNDSDRPEAIFVDEQGNVYVTGTSQFTSNSYKILTIKYSPAGSLLWKTAYDSLGQSDSRAEDIYVDNNGNVLVTGWISQTNNGYYDMVTIKMNNNGNVLDFAYFGQTTNADDFGKKIISDNSGNIFVGGDSFRNVTFGREAVIIKYNSSLDTSWVVRVNGTNNSFNEFTVEIALDDTGNVYSLCWLQNSPGGTDFAVLKINSNGVVIWRKEYDEAGGQDIPEAMTMDNNGNIYVTGRVRRSGGGGYNDIAIIKYNNDGVQQWISYYDGPNNLDDDPLDIILDQNGNVFVCGDSNREGTEFQFIVIKYNQNGIFEWEYVYEGNVEGKALSMHPDDNGYVYAAGETINSAGNLDLFAVKLSKTSDVNDDGSLVNSFKLFQNYPNPFNPNTSIQYAIGSRQFVTLKVFDVLGKEVATLVNEEKPAGNYQISFDASELASGIYLYRLSANSFTETKKLILIK
jgi:uncharacterized delta-60 repeat protein